MEARGETPQVTVFDGAEEVARAAAERFVELAQSAVRERGRFAVALSGGSTPKRTYELLAGDDDGGRVDWPKVHVFFGDERMVPPTDADSNYRMASEAMLSRLPVPPENVHRINGLGDALANARLYDDELRTFFNDAAWPNFDLVLLGMGDDGHTASLFPGTRALDEREAWAAANWVEKLDAYRVTLTAPAINHAAHVIFLVTGANKAAPLREVLKGGPDTRRLPAQLIRPPGGSLEWLVDRAAAARL
ncbi:MAG TPA: 6-phosphogluconolactonase [Pyrinomonadaceae bacterium]|jgi:6-phosphogluconolactonase